MPLFLVISLVICGIVSTTPISTEDNNQRIIGGFDAYAGQFPYQVSIRLALIGGHICAGSIISNQWILTSALCATTYPSWALRVVVGSIYLNSGGTTYKILFGVKHPDYNQNNIFPNDVGLLRVNGQITFSDLVSPIKLSSASSSTGLPFTVSGWGITNISKPAVSNTLQYVTLKSISISECQKEFPYPVYDTMICTYSNTGAGNCGGDNGNPLVHNGEQHGIASFAPYCGYYSYPDIYTKVASFRDWIKEISNV